VHSRALFFHLTTYHAATLPPLYSPPDQPMSWKWTEPITDTIPNTGQLSGHKWLRLRTASLLATSD
jgi:hypothetical protein